MQPLLFYMRITFTILFCLLSAFVLAQQAELKIITNTSSTVMLYKAKDSIAGIAENEIVFTVEKGFYRLKLSAAGYREINTARFAINRDTIIFISLIPKKESLENVVVVSRKPLITQDDDKTVVDAEPLSQSSTNAFEVLEKTPGAIVDQDGNVYLNSATAATIQINGKEVKLSAADIASLLKSLPANSVQKIEVLRTPSAKYDAGSSGGIVNIVLKKGIKLGTSGSVNAGYFQGKYHTATTGFNLNKSNGNIQSYFSYQYTNKKNFEQLNSDRFIKRDTSVISQQSYTTYPSFNHYLSAGFNNEINRKFSFGYDLRVSVNQNKSFAENDVLLSKQQVAIVNSGSFSDIHNKGNSIYISNTLSAKYKLDTTGSEWTGSIDYNFNNNANEQRYDINFSDNSRVRIAGNGDISSRKNILNLQSDLVYKLSRGYTFETGLKFINSFSSNSADYILQKGNDLPVRDSFQTNKFTYTEGIYAAYVQLSKTFAGLTVKPGVRIERTNINGHQIFPAESRLSIKRTDAFPYLYLRREIIKLFGFKLTGNLIFRRSISRPFYEALNPYPKFIDQYLFDVGNPDLKPQFTTNYEFNIMADQFPVFSIGLNDTKNIFTNVTYQDEITKIAYRTYDNLGKNKELYLRFVGGIPPGKKYFFYAGAQHNYNHFKGLYQNVPFDYSRGSWTFFMYHNLKATPTFNITMNGFMRLRGFQNFYELKPFGALHMSFNKSIIQKKANIILSVNDIFKTNIVDFCIGQAGISANGTRFNDTRRIGLTFRYNFGIKPREEKKNNFDAPSE